MATDAGAIELARAPKFLRAGERDRGQYKFVGAPFKIFDAKRRKFLSPQRKSLPQRLLVCHCNYVIFLNYR